MGYLLLGIFLLLVFGAYPLLIGLAGSAWVRWVLKIKGASRWLCGGCLVGSWLVAALLYALNVGVLSAVGFWVYSVGIALGGWLGLRLQGHRRGDRGVLLSRRF